MMANQKAIKVQVGKYCTISVFQGDNNDSGFGGTLNSHLAWRSKAKEFVQGEASRVTWRPGNPDNTLRKAVKEILLDAANAESASFWGKVEDYIKETTTMETMEEGQDKITLGKEISAMKVYAMLRIRNSHIGHRFGVTKETRKIAFVPPSTKTSDLIYAVKGLSKPLIFRRKFGMASQGMGEVYQAGRDEVYLIFDECYVDGRMGMVKSSSWEWLTVV
jgi:hypothetical protein